MKRIIREVRSHFLLLVEVNQLFGWLYFLLVELPVTVYPKRCDGCDNHCFGTLPDAVDPEV